MLQTDKLTDFNVSELFRDNQVGRAYWTPTLFIV